ncbi:MAG: esterase-like activity of phytase family protein [Algicola sp.]|nr:esterase-like activity of phytase family protein [Algicola sp.]
MACKRHLLIMAAILQLSLSANATAPFHAIPVDIPETHSALNIVHKNRGNSGGFSAMWMSQDCTRLVIISDYSQVALDQLDMKIKRSGWYQAKINFDKNDRMLGLTVIQQGQLRDTDGTILSGAAESMEWDGKGFLVSFDGRGDIYRYAGKSPLEPLLNTTPTIAYAQPNLGKGNSGLEALTVLHNGKVFALWEKLKGQTVAKGLIISKVAASQAFNYIALTNPGGATTMVDGSVLIVEKQWLGIGKGQRLRLLRIPFEDLDKPVSSFKGQVLVDNKSLEYDNNEGVSSCTRNSKEFAFIITDDNGDWPAAVVEGLGKKRQRSLLLQIDLTQAK